MKKIQRSKTVKSLAEEIESALPVSAKNGWQFPFAGDDWPEKDGWYWVAAPKAGRSCASALFVPHKKWWDDKKYIFWAVDETLVIAYKKV
mgnify:FL=1